MTEHIDRISPTQFEEMPDLEDWRLLSDGACAFFPTDSLAISARLVQSIAALPAVEDNPPDIDVRRDGVTVRLLTITRSYAGISSRDVETARRVSEVARDLGISSEPSELQSLLVVPGATRIADVVPFWKAMLDYEPREDSPAEDLIDRHGRGPAFWFEQMEEPRPDGGGAIHLAVWVPYEKAQARVDAALAAGGRMVRDQFAPMWWTLADAAGNEADIATVKGRD